MESFSGKPNDPKNMRSLLGQCVSVDGCELNGPSGPYTLWRCDSLEFLKQLPRVGIFDLVVTSPPYNIGKEYEKKTSIRKYLEWQAKVIEELIPRVRENGSICWQVGNFVENGSIEPLDFLIHPLFSKMGLKLRNRIVWHFGHGLHCQRRFSGRYEVILWYTKTDEYQFDLDAVRIPAKYPAKRFYKGPRKGEYSSNPKGKNPEDFWVDDSKDECDVWDIPNVKGNHKEKTTHPCQFPVGLAERLILALTKKGDMVFDPFSGVASTGVAAAVHGRNFWGCELSREYVRIGKERICKALKGEYVYRPHNTPLYDHRQSPLSIMPKRLGDSRPK